MADLIVDGDELVLRLTTVEKAEALHGDVRVPLDSVTSIEVVGRVTSGETKVFASFITVLAGACA